MKVLGYHISDKEIADSDGIICNSPNFEFLLFPKPETIRIMYDLDYSIGMLGLFGMPRFSIIELNTTTRLTIEPYHIRYIQGKFFSIKRPGAFTYYTNAKQYYPNYESSSILSAKTRAIDAKCIGEDVLRVFEDLGLDATSLTSAERAYTKTQMKWLFEERKAILPSNALKAKVIDNIGIGVFGESWTKFLEEAKMVSSTDG